MLTYSSSFSSHKSEEMKFLPRCCNHLGLCVSVNTYGVINVHKRGAKWWILPLPWQGHSLGKKHKTRLYSPTLDLSICLENIFQLIIAELPAGVHFRGVFRPQSIQNRSNPSEVFVTRSRRRPLSYRNQSIDLLCKSMGWFLHEYGLRHGSVKKKSSENI